MNKIISLLLKLQSKWAYWLLTSVAGVSVGLSIGYFINKINGDDYVTNDIETSLGSVLSDSKIDEVIKKVEDLVLSSGRRNAKSLTIQTASNHNDDNNDEDEDSDDSSGINTPPIILFTDTSFIAARYKFG